ncbi:MAG: hypothetical protein QOD65_4038 [Gaiellales bacterium]|nr:hypothetical protein [Gaiellales bacterium]
MTDTEAHAGFRSALASCIANDLARIRRRRSRARKLAVGGAVAAVTLALVLAQPFGRGQSAVARAQAGLDLPGTGILHVTSYGAGGRVVEEVWQSLSNPSEYRRLEADPRDASGPHENAIAGGVRMRFDTQSNTIFTQRVIEAVGAFSETINLPDLHRWLALPGIRDRGVVEDGARRLRRLDLPGAQGTPETFCSYYADAESFLPVRLDCSRDAREAPAMPVRARAGVTDYAFLPDTPANRAHFSLLDAHPGAAMEQDPMGIPGKAGDDLSAVTSAGIEDATAGRDDLQRTDQVAMRRARELEVELNRAAEACFPAHGAERVPLENTGEGFTFHDPSGTVGAICEHFMDGRNAVGATPAGSALQDREVARAKDIHGCIEARHPSAAERTAVTRDCASRSRDPFLDSLPGFR